ncbi:hypothetical protein PM082_001821 [Marasmius tenuissimus]|nr:hypothetical protein PM082_001821 [Marasmius tenuissimus]
MDADVGDPAEFKAFDVFEIRLTRTTSGERVRVSALSFQAESKPGQADEVSNVELEVAIWRCSREVQTFEPWQIVTYYPARSISFCVTVAPVTFTFTQSIMITFNFVTFLTSTPVNLSCVRVTSHSRAPSRFFPRDDCLALITSNILNLDLNSLVLHIQGSALSLNVYLIDAPPSTTITDLRFTSINSFFVKHDINPMEKRRTNPSVGHASTTLRRQRRCLCLPSMQDAFVVVNGQLSQI